MKRQHNTEEPAGTRMMGWPDGAPTRTASDQEVWQDRALELGLCGTLMGHGRICVEAADGKCPVHPRRFIPSTTPEMKEEVARLARKGLDARVIQERMNERPFGEQWDVDLAQVEECLRQLRLRG